MGPSFENNESFPEFCLPKELTVLKRIDGGGNSLFEAVLVAVRDTLDDEGLSLPDDHFALRKEVITELLNNPRKYNLPVGKHERNRVKLMLNPDQIPCCEALLAMSFLYQIEIRVFHNMPTPVIYRASDVSHNIIYLQCISHVHYNPLFCRKAPKEISDGKLVNVIQNLSINVDSMSHDCSDDDVLENINMFDEVTKECGYRDMSPGIVLSYNSYSLCTLIDTGAQICLISNDTWDKIKVGSETVCDAKGASILGLGGESSNIVGFVYLKLICSGDSLPSEFPFAIVPNSILPCCLLLGINFLTNFKSIINFSNDTILLNEASYSMSCVQFSESDNLLLCNLDNFEYDDLDCAVPNVKFNISIDDLKVMQSSTHAIKLLRQRVANKILPRD